MKKYFIAFVIFFSTAIITILKVFRMGQHYQRNKQDKKSLKAIETSKQVQNEINAKSDANIRDSLSKWVRK